MKEASGELNMTAITILAIAAVGAFFYLVVWPGLQTNITNSQKCSSATCQTCNGGVAECTWVNDKGETETIKCGCKNQ